jgi:hypothetical protein
VEEGLGKGFGCVYALIVLGAFAFISNPLHAYPTGWSDDILLTPEDNKNRQSCDVDADCFNNVWAVWDSATWVNGTAEVLFTKRDSMGGCLIPETPVSNNPTFSIVPRLAVDASNNVQFLWRDWSPQGDGIWHAKLANDGSTLVPSHLAVSGAGGGESTLLPELVINKYNELYIIWDESPSGYNQMNFTRLDSLGNPIIDKIQVSLPGVYAYWPGIGVDSMANVHMGFRSDSGIADRLTYTKLDKDGNFLISNRFFGTGLLPTIIADRSQNMHIVYGDPAGPGISIEYLKLDQNGDILVGPLTLSVHQNNFCPHMAMDSLQYLHVVWAFISDSSGLMYAKMDTLGNYIIPPMTIVYPPYCVYPYEPRIAVDLSNRLHLVWADQRLNPGVVSDIFYKRGENETGIEETNQSPPKELWNIGVSPNPFRYSTDIRYQITDNRQKCELKIYDITGRLVTNLSEQISVIGDQSSVKWDGTDNQGNRLPAGVYFVRIRSSGGEQSVPVVLLR